MIKQTQYLFFNLIESLPKTNIYEVVSRSQNARLGLIKWYGPWRQYIFYPEAETLFNKGCLIDIIEFIKEIKNN